MKCFVTGAAGFIGSHLCEALLREGHHVTGLDALIPYYPEVIKQRNLVELLSYPHFRCYRADLRTAPLDKLVEGADVVFHLAAMPGLMKSWTDFDDYMTCNVQATQRLLEALRHDSGSIKKLIYASTSSVYGLVGSGDESLPTRPVSPYGVTKLAAEHLCRAFADACGLPVVILRYFSVYGPRQRPDMGYHKFIRALLRDEAITVHGDGQQLRGNTYIGDCVSATLAAAHAQPGEIYNVGGGESASVWDIIHKLEALAGRRAKIRQDSPRPGDQRQTLADTSKIRRDLGWSPTTPLDAGLSQQWQWQKSLLEESSKPNIDSSGDPAQFRTDIGSNGVPTPFQSRPLPFPRQ